MNAIRRKRKCSRAGFTLLALAYLFAVTGCSQPNSAKDNGATGAQDLESLAAANNRGVGLMGQFKYTEAREIFAAIHDEHPGEVDVTVNLAIARLNEQGEENVSRAMQLLDEAIDKSPRHARANYCRGLLRLYAGEPEEAVANFTVASEEAPEDAYATYLRGLCLEQTGEHVAAGAQYERTLELDSYYASALLGLSRVARQSGDLEKTKQYIAEFEKLKDNPYARVFEFKYMAMGRLGEVWAIGDQSAPPALPSGELFAALEPLSVENADTSQLGGRGITLVDLNADSALDIVLVSDKGECAVLTNDGSENFALNEDHPLLSLKNVAAIMHGDVDNDSRVDHVVVGKDGVRIVWGSGAPTSDLAEVLGEGTEVRSGLLFDADHDGDLDIYCVCANGPDLLLNNDRDGGFRALGSELGIDSGAEQTRQVCVADFDNDRDLDILLLKEAGNLLLLENDRLWNYRRREVGSLLPKDVASCVVSDTNQDGWMDIVAACPQDRSSVEISTWTGHPGLRFELADTFAEPTGTDSKAPTLPSLGVSDLDGDGLPEVLVAVAHARITVLGPGLERKTEIGGLATHISGAWALANFSDSHGPSIVSICDSGLCISKPGAGRYQFAAASFGGKHDPGDSLRSNFSGIGTRWRARAGRFATSGYTLPTTSGPSQSLQPTHIGLGGRKQIDTLEIIWPDGVFQSEVAVAPGKLHQIVETQRQLSSCPVLFAWNGTEYAFVTDLIGVGGMGYLVKPGLYGTPRPFERLLLEQQQLQQRSGRLALKLGEPMEEVCYLDHVSMQVVDVPRGWSAALDERAGVNQPAPTSNLFFYQNDRVLTPATATNDRGEDMLSAISEVDDVAAGVGPIDKRFIGMLEQEHLITLTFDRTINTQSNLAGSPVLLIDGWIEYPYSQTNFAAWQAGLEHEEPTIEARGADGEWVTVLDKFGYPAGMPRAMSVPLADLPAGTQELRIRTNLEIYWDRIRVAYAETCPEARVADLQFAGAHLARVGFAQRSTGSQRHPEYDYSQRTPTWDARHPTGDYTRFGDVGELVADRDDALAIIGPGEEVHFEFFAADSLPAPGTVRCYIISAAGWCKDMDMYTRTGGTVEPLPFADPANADSQRRAALHAKYNTRFESGK